MGSTIEIMLAACLGLFVGGATALLHLRWSWAGAARAVRASQPRRVLPGGLLRVVTLAVVIAALARVHLVAFAVGLVAFFVIERIGLRRAAQGGKPWTPYS